MLRELEHMMYKDRLRKLVVLPREEMAKGYLIALGNYLKSGYREHGARLFLGLPSKRTRGSEYQLQQDKS